MLQRILIAICLTALAACASSADDAKKTLPPAKVFFTADLGCLHCDFGIGESCAGCLKLDDKKFVVLEGKVAKQLENDLLDNKVVAIEGALTRGKDGQLVLASDKAAFVAAADKGFAAKGTVRCEGTPVCGSCDLKLCEQCTLAIANGACPIILDGPLATKHRADEGGFVRTMGKLFIDKRGLVRLQATKVELQDKAP